jgi:hypothetical protein
MGLTCQGEKKNVKYWLAYKRLNRD